MLLILMYYMSCVDCDRQVLVLIIVTVCYDSEKKAVRSLSILINSGIHSEATMRMIGASMFEKD